jgi:hypothetical protein
MHGVEVVITQHTIIKMVKLPHEDKEMKLQITLYMIASFPSRYIYFWYYKKAGHCLLVRRPNNQKP